MAVVSGLLLVREAEHRRASGRTLRLEPVHFSSGASSRAHRWRWRYIDWLSRRPDLPNEKFECSLVVTRRVAETHQLRVFECLAIWF